MTFWKSKLLGAATTAVSESLSLQDLDVYVLYYSGHGQVHSGTWLVTEDESISFQELLELSRSYAVPFGKLLVVIADSCYAGALCKAHKEAFNREKDRRAASNLIVFAATQPDLDAAENDDGGDFTTWFLTQLDVPLYTLFEKAKRQEVDQHGNDSFAIFRNVQKLPTRPLQKPMSSGLLAFADVNKVQEPSCASCASASDSVLRWLPAPGMRTAAPDSQGRWS